jgi:menaquinone-dependent protoporphyrinogen IX oxidase
LRATLYSQNEGQLAIMTEWMIKNLQEAGIQALLQPVLAAEAEAHVTALVAVGEAVLWLAWR